MTNKPQRASVGAGGRALRGLDEDLEQALKSVVTIQSSIPPDAYTAATLGDQRSGSGVVIRDSGLVLTIGYLITEAETIWIASHDDRVVPAHALAIDQESGLGLVQALDRLDLPALPFGRSGELAVGDPVVVAAGGKSQFVRASVLGKQEFAGYWEYRLDEAIFTAPAHPFWGGAGLIGQGGKLLGIGSLHVEQATPKGQQIDLNMVVPIDLLPPALDDLLTYGRLNRPPRPWLGVYSAESEGEVVIANVADRGPAEAAGLRPGDVIAGVAGASVIDLGDFYRKVWSRGSAGVEVPIEIIRDGRVLGVRVKTADRASFLKRPRLQ